MSFQEISETTFNAAGILPFFCKNGKIYIIVAKEKRKNKSKYNFIGGKREKNESPKDTALREFFEEVGCKRDKIEEYIRDCMTLKYYNPVTGYWLYKLHIDGELVDYLKNSEPQDGLEEISVLDILKIEKDDWHVWAYEIVKILSNTMNINMREKRNRELIEDSESVYQQ